MLRGQVQGKRLIRCVVYALAALAVGAPEASAQERNCFWTVAEDANAVNVAYPDEGANYWAGTVSIPPGGELIMRGRFPHTRYMSFNVYDQNAAPTDAIADFEIQPDSGSTNPFRPRARRNTRRRSYTLRVVPGVPPQQREPNTVYLSIGGQPSSAGSIMYRTYVPDRGLGDSGGVPLPAVSLRLSNGTELDQAATCDFLNTNSPPVVNDAYASSEGIAPSGVTGDAKNPIEWSAFFNTYQAVLGGRLQGTPAYQFVPQDRSGGYFSNVHNAYASARTSRGFAPVLVLEGKAPTFPRTRSGQARMRSGQVRYWSLCQNETASTRFVDCLVDEDAILGPGRRITVVISTPANRPANAIERCGVTWLAWGATSGATVILRHMLPSARFAQAIQNAQRPDLVDEQVGEYLPAGAHVRREEFEARGCPASAQRAAIRLSVTPRTALVGERTRFRFKATAGGRAVKGATIRFAGKRARTGRRGRARLAGTLRRRGRYRARAARSGMLSGSALVRAVRR
jgi:hypothetical protein